MIQKNRFSYLLLQFRVSGLEQPLTRAWEYPVFEVSPPRPRHQTNHITVIDKCEALGKFPCSSLAHMKPQGQHEDFGIHETGEKSRGKLERRRNMFCVKLCFHLFIYFFLSLGSPEESLANLLWWVSSSLKHLSILRLSKSCRMKDGASLRFLHWNLSLDVATLDGGSFAC